MSKIKMLVTTIDAAGVGFFRMKAPHIHLQEMFQNDIHIDIIDISDFTDITRYKDYNIIFCHRSLTPDIGATPEIYKRLKQQNPNQIIIGDIDDHWLVDPSHGLYQIIKFQQIDKKIVENLKIFDYVTTTNEYFASKIRQYNKNVVIFPNAINPRDKQFIPNREENDRIGVGYLGGSSHLKDLQLLHGVTNVLSGDKSIMDKTQLVLCGFDLRGTKTTINAQTGEQMQEPIKPHETVWYDYEKIVTDNYNIISPQYKNYLDRFTQGTFDDKNEPYRRRWTLPINKYATNYNYFDISLAPLVETEFNRVKSSLKVMEAGFHKKALIASHIEPYSEDIIDGKNGFLIEQKRSHKDWHKTIKKLINNPEQIKDMGEALYETVKEKYNLDFVSKNRMEFYRSVIK
jgi:glycosyltransferase involved in cell wall biosynthesis